MGMKRRNNYLDFKLNILYQYKLLKKGYIFLLSMLKNNYRLMDYDNMRLGLKIKALNALMTSIVLSLSSITANSCFIHSR